MDSWTGELGDFWTSRAEQYERLMAPHARRLVEGAALRETEQVVDVGCGTGPSTRLAGERAASALGLDVSPAMVATARSRTSQANVGFEVADVQSAPLPRCEVVVSQFGLMFFQDPARAFDNIGHAITRGGRIAFLCWRDHDENENRTLPREIAGRYVELPELRPSDLPGAFSLADPEVVRTLLTGAGFGNVALEAVDEPMTWGTDLEDAVAFCAEDRLGWLEAGSEARAAAERDLRDELRARDLRLGSAAWLVTATR